MDVESVDIQSLRAFLRQHLPDYMCPAAYMVLESLPVTPGGKVNRAALPAPDAQSYTLQAYEAPVGDIEIGLAQIFADVLKLEKVGRNDNFFELGGHSLIATQFTSRTKDVFGIQLPLNLMLDDPTVRGVAEKISIGVLLRQTDDSDIGAAEVERVRV